MDEEIEFDLDYVLDSIVELKSQIVELHNILAEIQFNLKTHHHIP